MRLVNYLICMDILQEHIAIICAIYSYLKWVLMLNVESPSMWGFNYL